MDGLTHRRSPVVRNWAVCGAVAEAYVDDPTCLWCTTNTWAGDDTEIVRVFQEAEDKKLCEMLLKAVATSS